MINNSNLDLTTINIDNINNSSELLNIKSIVKIDQTNINDGNIMAYIKRYESLFHSNDYSSFKCPCCRGSNFKFHKTYKRNITLILSEYLLEGTIDIIVVECLDCKNNKEQQHYHAILPDFVLPYHLSSTAVILNAINDKIDKVKNEIIMEKYRISRQLLSKWLNLMNKYLLSSSIVLSLEVDIGIIVKGIIGNKDIFLYEFYNKYFHPFFLNKRTCVELAITP